MYTTSLKFAGNFMVNKEITLLAMISAVRYSIWRVIKATWEVLHRITNDG